VYLCYRHRGSYREETFEAMAAAAGFSVEKLPDTHLGTQYQGLGFQLYKLRRGQQPAQPEPQAPATTTSEPQQPATTPEQQPPATTAEAQPPPTTCPPQPPSTA
jgi:hypothetical protein